MTYRGRVRDGVVVLDASASLPEGTEVRVEPVGEAAETCAPRQDTLAEVMLRFAGKAKGLPPDASLNHDHYLYGTPKR